MENNIKLMVIYGDLVMNKEDYFKYYIQGSDHYLIPKDVFDELFEEMESWKEDTQKYKEVIDKAIKLLGNYKHYSTPDEKQNSDNEDLVNNALDILKEVE